MIRFSPFLAGDARALFAPDAHGGLAPAHIAAIERAGRESDEAWTMLNDGRPRAVGGVVTLWPGVADLWSFRADDFRPGEGFAFARFCRRVADRVMAGDLARLQATARADDPKARHMLDFLGMSVEGRLVAFGPDGADHIQYARVAARAARKAA
jgi:hypothetical protein